MDKPSFEEALRALAARQRAGEHPAPEELLAYRGGDLTAEEDDRIQEHLTQCRDCARLLLDLAEFEQLPPPPEEVGPVDARAEASWQRFRARLGEEGEEEPVVAAQAGERRMAHEEEGMPAAPAVRELRPRPAPTVPAWRKPFLPWALAAGLALCVLGLGLRVGTLQSRAGRLSAPQLNVSVEDLLAGTTRSSGADDIPVLRDGGVLVLTPPELMAEYEVEVVSTADAAVVTGPLRGPAVDDVLTLGIPPSSLPAGDYSARLYGLENGQRQPLGEYPFKISRAAP